jgi:hypothetical protein
VTIGKYQREALERERLDLQNKRQFNYRGLTVAEGARLDEITAMLGDDPFVQPSLSGRDSNG